MLLSQNNTTPPLKQSVRVATQYAPALLPLGRPKKRLARHRADAT